MEIIKKILKEKGISPSIHRLKILQYIFNNKNHPTADTIYKAISPEIPTLSKTTVYNTLHMLVNKKILFTVTPVESEIRYDLNLEPHVHFKCDNCGELYDLKENVPFSEEMEIDGHQVNNYLVYFTGKCKACMQKERNARTA